MVCVFVDKNTNSSLTQDMRYFKIATLKYSKCVPENGILFRKAKKKKLKRKILWRAVIALSFYIQHDCWTQLFDGGKSYAHSLFI